MREEEMVGVGVVESFQNTRRSGSLMEVEDELEEEEVRRERREFENVVGVGVGVGLGREGWEEVWVIVSILVYSHQRSPESRARKVIVVEGERELQIINSLNDMIT